MITIAALLAVFSFSAWSCFCSWRTFVQRRVLWGRLLRIDVSFEAHYLRLLTLRNPWELYPADVQAEVA